MICPISPIKASDTKVPSFGQNAPRFGTDVLGTGDSVHFSGRTKDAQYWFEETLRAIQYLKTGNVANFNQIKQAFDTAPEGPKVLKLSRLDLSGSTLEGVNLANTDLSEANLEHVRWAKANLTGANLKNAKMFDADLSHAILSKADVTLAELKNASLEGATMKGVLLHTTNLEGAILNKADLSGADIKDANLIQATLEGANLTDATLVRTDLNLATLDNANLTRARLVTVNMTNARLYQTIFSDTSFYKIKGVGIGRHRRDKGSGFITVIAWRDPKQASEVATIIMPSSTYEKEKDILKKATAKALKALGKPKK